MRDIWVRKWLKVARAATMAEKSGGYESVVALLGTRETPALISAPSIVTRSEYDAFLEYTCALKTENAELKSDGGDDVTTISTLVAASAATETATNNTTGLLADMRAVHAAQMQEMTAIVAASTAINAPAPPRREEKAQIHMNLAVTCRVCYLPP